MESAAEAALQTTFFCTVCSRLRMSLEWQLNWAISGWFELFLPWPDLFLRRNTNPVLKGHLSKSVLSTATCIKRTFAVHKKRQTNFGLFFFFPRAFGSACNEAWMHAQTACVQPFCIYMACFCLKTEWSILYEAKTFFFVFSWGMLALFFSKECLPILQCHSAWKTAVRN